MYYLAVSLLYKILYLLKIIDLLAGQIYFRMYSTSLLQITPGSASTRLTPGCTLTHITSGCTLTQITSGCTLTQITPGRTLVSYLVSLFVGKRISIKRDFQMFLFYGTFSTATSVVF